jgi:4-hydroxy-3-methylbut-2-enyl diphosphate reductase
VSDELIVVAPLRIEAAALRHAVPGARVLRGGLGPTRSARTAALLGASPARAVAVAGFAGGLDSELAPGQVVVATEVRGPQGTRTCPSSALLLGALHRLGVAAVAGPVISADHLVRGAERSRLAESAVAADMESAWLAEGAGERPFAVLRVVLDGPRHELIRPGTLARLLKARRSLRRAAPALADWAAAVGPRRVLLAEPRSFCAGVERALEIVERTLERYGAPVFVRRQIVHNVHVVRDLERRGAVFVDSVNDVPPGSVLVFSAHGVSPLVRTEAEARRLQVIDATCPLVAKVHAEARRLVTSGYRVLLIGHHGHDETEGTLGEAPGAIRLVPGISDVDALDIGDGEPVAYLTQTTLAVDETATIIAALCRRYPSIVGPPSSDICYASQNRQEAVRAVARQCELLLVVGSTNSSNSNRLVEVAEREGCPARLIDDETQLDPAWLAGVDTVGLTAGASAPPWIVEVVLAALAGLGPLEVVERSVATESVHFALPPKLR